MYLFVRPPTFPECRQAGRDDVGDYDYEPPYTTLPLAQATARTSSGDVAPLPWRIVGDADGPQYLRLEIPGGYSRDCLSLDVTLVPNSGPFPRWRITRLPVMRHIISDTPQITNRVTANGLTATTSAWRSRHEVFLQVRPNLRPKSHHWELMMNGQWSEWEKFGQLHTQIASGRQPIEGRDGVFTFMDKTPYGNLTAQFPGDYRSASRYVRMECGLRQFETLDETVTFHNLTVSEEKFGGASEKAYRLIVPQPITLTTPSGIAVTLPAQGVHTFMNVFAQSVNVQLTANLHFEAAELPHSPLVQQFGKPPTVSINFAPPQQLSSWSTGSGGTQTYQLRLPSNPIMNTPQGDKAWLRSLKTKNPIPTSLDAPSHLKNLTVIVHQRVDIQTIPMTFTVPVSNTPPPDVK